MSNKYEQALQEINSIYSKDPNTEEWKGKTYPKEKLYADRMLEMLLKFRPDADEAQLLAAYCQHFCRWEVPRDSYPKDKKGYHQWRTYLYTYQAEKTSQVLTSVGYDQDTIDRVYKMVSKKGIKTNPDTQLIEDVLCLIFILYYAESFAEQYKDNLPKLFNIIQKTWAKMSDDGHTAALNLPLKPEVLDLVKAALADI